MERTPDEVLRDENKKPKGDAAEFQTPVSSSLDNKQVNIVKEKGEKVYQDATPARMNSSGEVNMEASIVADDVIRAGGFGARDDISSFLPVASDSTDFEAMIRDAREYEEPQGEVCRPGLGWRRTTETK